MRISNARSEATRMWSSSDENVERVQRGYNSLDSSDVELVCTISKNSSKHALRLTRRFAPRPLAALEYYKKALQIKPRYGRCWLNLAISHSNLRDYEEASRCYLQVISLNEDAVHCWGYLRLSLTCLERWDLLEKAGRHDLESFRDEFDFV